MDEKFCQTVGVLKSLGIATGIVLMGALLHWILQHSGLLKIYNTEIEMQGTKTYVGANDSIIDQFTSGKLSIISNYHK